MGVDNFDIDGAQDYNSYTYTQVDDIVTASHWRLGG